jgi:hypothetical protein
MRRSDPWRRPPDEGVVAHREIDDERLRRAAVGIHVAVETGHPAQRPRIDPTPCRMRPLEPRG